MSDHAKPGRNRSARRLAALTSAALVVGLTAGPAQAREDVPGVATSPPIVEPQVWDELATDEPTDFWAYLRDETDLAPATAITDRGAQGRFAGGEP